VAHDAGTGRIRCVLGPATGEVAVLFGDVLLAVVALEEPDRVAVHDDAIG